MATSALRSLSRRAGGGPVALRLLQHMWHGGVEINIAHFSAGARGRRYLKWCWCCWKSFLRFFGFSLRYLTDFKTILKIQDAAFGPRCMHHATLQFFIKMRICSLTRARSCPSLRPLGVSELGFGAVHFGNDGQGTETTKQNPFKKGFRKVAGSHWPWVS